MNDSVQLRLIEELIINNVKDANNLNLWTGVDPDRYPNTTATTKHIQLISKSNINNFPCVYSEADRICEKLRKEGINKFEFDQLSLFFSYIYHFLEKSTYNKIPGLCLTMSYLHSKVGDKDKIGFQEPEPEEDQVEEGEGDSSIEEQRYRHIRPSASLGSPIRKKSAAVRPVRAKDKRKSLEGITSRSRSAKSTKKYNVLSRYRGIEVPTTSASFNPESVVEQPLSSASSLSSLVDEGNQHLLQGESIKGKELFVTARFDSTQKSLGDGYLLTVDDILNREYPEIVSPLQPDRFIADSDTVMSDKGPENMETVEGGKRKRGQKDDDEVQDVPRNKVVKGVVSGVSAGAPGAPGGGDSDDEGSDDEGGDADGGRRDRDGRDERYYGATGLPDTQIKPPLVELNTFVMRDLVKSVLVPLVEFSNLPDGLACLQMGDMNANDVDLTDDIYQLDIELVDDNAVVRGDNLGSVAPLPRSNTKFLYQKGNLTYEISPADYAIYWSVAFRINGNISPTRNMIIVQAVHLPNLSLGKKIVREVLGDMIAEYSVIRLVACEVIIKPSGLTIVSFSEHYFKSASADWNITDVKLTQMREGCQYAGFDLQGTIMEAAKKYTDGDGHLTRVSRKMLAMDLKIVSMVTFYRGYSTQKVFQKWEDQEMLDLFKSICLKLGIKSTKVETPGKTELTLSRVPIIVPYAQPKYCLLEEKPGVIQIYQLPKACHCGSFVGCVPNLPEWKGVFCAGVTYLIFQDNVINKKRKTPQLVSSLVSFSEVAQNAPTTMTVGERISRMRALGITPQVQTSFMAYISQFDLMVNETTKTAANQAKVSLSVYPELWGPTRV